ncbi:MAG: hypothetical protein ACXW33_09975 [Sulfuricurvum sp.]
MRSNFVSRHPVLDTGSINGSGYRVGARDDNVDHGMTNCMV